MANAYIILCVGLMASVSAAPAGAASTGKVLHSFGGAAAGDTPQAGVYEDTSSNLFGTVSDEHTKKPKKDLGLVYELKHRPGGWLYQTIHRFGGSPGDGAAPTGALIPDGTGALYGTTGIGGTNYQNRGAGTVFKLTPPGAGQKQWAETILYEFTGGADGQFTGGGLIFDSQGSLYGTNGSSGSSGGGNGTVFQLTPPVAGKTNWVESTIYTFQGGTDGSTPAGAALVQDGSGALYGTTEFGGSSTSCQGHQGCGTVFKLTPPAQGQAAWTESVLYRFTGDADGAMPLTNLVLDSVGNLYGTTNLGGADGEGVMFELSPTGGDQAGWSETVLHSFTGDPDGLWPVGNLIRESNGVLLVSARGGTGGLNGAIVQLTPSTAGEVWREKVIYSFPSNGAGGTNPVGLLLDTSGDIFGATESGGAANFGTVFEVHP